MAFTDKVRELLSQSTNGITTFNTQINSAYIAGLLTPLVTAMARQQIYKDMISTSQSLVKILEAEQDAEKIQEYADSMGLTTTEVAAALSAFIDNFIGNFGIPRNPALPSTGIIQVGRDTPLAISDPDSVLTVGIQFQTSSGEIFSVSSQTTMYAALGQTYYDSVLDKYVVNVPVEAVTPGRLGNVAAETILYPVGSFTSGFNYVTNKSSFTNGSDAESDTEYIARFLSTSKASNLGTSDGYKSRILNNFTQITDAFVADAGSLFLSRERGYGGAADIYILEQGLSGTKEDVTFDGFILSHTMALQPVVVITPSTDIIVSGINPSSVPTIFVNGVDYTIALDTNRTTKNSGRSTTRLIWLTTGVNPKIGSTYSIFHLYDKNVSDIQTFFDDPLSKITGVDILIRQSTKVEVNVEFSIEVASGYSFTEVQNNAITAINNLSNELKLGKTLSQSMIVDTVASVPGVVTVKIPFTVFNETGLLPVVSEVTVDSTEYIRIGSLTINES